MVTPAAELAGYDCKFFPASLLDNCVDELTSKLLLFPSLEASILFESWAPDATFPESPSETLESEEFRFVDPLTPSSAPCTP